MTEQKPAGIHGVMVALQSSLAVGKDEYNRFGGYAFRNAEGILKAAKPVATKYGARFRIRAHTERLGDGSVWMSVEAALVAADGTEEAAYCDGPVAESRKGMVEEQLVGSARSYYLKYALMDLLAISDGDDDPDGRDNRQAEASKPRSSGAGTGLEAARRSLIDACREYAKATGTDEREAMAEASQLPGFEKTASGYLTAAATMRDRAAKSGQTGD